MICPACTLLLLEYLLEHNTFRQDPQSARLFPLTGVAGCGRIRDTAIITRYKWTPDSGCQGTELPSELHLGQSNWTIPPSPWAVTRVIVRTRRARLSIRRGLWHIVSDIKFRFSFNGGYALPIGKEGRSSAEWEASGKLMSGWELTGIVTWQTGLPFSPLDGFNSSQDGNTGTPDRPSCNPNFTGNLYTENINEWFNPNAFILSPLGTYGNAGEMS